MKYVRETYGCSDILNVLTHHSCSEGYMSADNSVVVHGQGVKIGTGVKLDGNCWSVR